MTQCCSAIITGNGIGGSNFKTTSSSAIRIKVAADFTTVLSWNEKVTSGLLLNCVDSPMSSHRTRHPPSEISVTVKLVPFITNRGRACNGYRNRKCSRECVESFMNDSALQLCALICKMSNGRRINNERQIRLESIGNRLRLWQARTRVANPTTTLPLNDIRHVVES